MHTTLTALRLADDIRESLLDFEFYNGNDDMQDGCKMPVRFKEIYETWKGGHIILRVDQEQTPRDFYLCLLKHPHTLPFLSSRLAKPVRLVQQSNGEIEFVIDRAGENAMTQEPENDNDLGPGR